MTRKSRFSFSHPYDIRCYMRRLTQWEMRRSLITSRENEKDTFLPLSGLALVITLIIIYFWGKRKQPHLTHSRTAKFSNKSSLLRLNKLDLINRHFPTCFKGRKKLSHSTHCQRVKFHRKRSTSRNKGKYVVKYSIHHLLLFEITISESTLVWTQRLYFMSKARRFDRYHIANLSQFLLLLSGDVESNPGPYTDGDVKEVLQTICEKTLSEDDWDEVVSTLEPLESRWRDIGRKLGIRPSTIDSIFADHSQCGPCLSEVIKHWLKLNYDASKFGQPSWRKLAKAVSAYDKRLFYSLANDHKAGGEDSLTNEQACFSGEMKLSVQKTLLKDNAEGGDVEALFPYLSTDMKQHERDNLIYRLKDEASKIQDNFISLVISLRKNLKQSELSSEDVIEVLATKDPDLQTVFRECKTIDEIFKEGWKYWSYFDYEPIQSLITCLFDEKHNLRTRLTEYLEHFKSYASRRVAECPSNIHSKQEEDEKVLVFKIEEMTYEKLTMKDLKLLCFRLNSAISCYHLSLLSTSDGCIQLTFRTNLKREDKKFELSKEQQEALRDIGVISVSYGDQEYNLKYSLSSESQEVMFSPDTCDVREFSEDLSSGDLYKYLLFKNVPKRDCDIIKEEGITGLCFLGLSKEDWKDYKLSRAGVIAVAKLQERIRAAQIEASTSPHVSAGKVIAFALHVASQNGQVEVAKSLLERGAQINLQTIDGTSALHIASQNGYLDVAKLLLENGAKVDLLNNDQCSPLMIACEQGLNDIAKVLLDHDADTYLRNKKGQTALEIAREKNHVDIISLFVELKEKAAYPGILFSEGVKKESITSDEKTINLEDVGISIIFPENSLPSTDPPLEIFIRPCFSGSFEMPDGIKSVSPAYMIKYNRKITFLKDVILKIRHYANLQTEEDCENMVFLSARCIPEYRGSSPVYMFKEITDTKGLFWPRQEKPLGEIHLKHFSIITIGIKRLLSWIGGHFSSKLYSARLFRTENSAVFCMCLYQPLYMQQCKEVIEKEYTGVQKPIEYNGVTLSSNEVTIRTSENNEWKVAFQKTEILRAEIERQEDYQDNFKELLELNYPPRIDISVTLTPVTPNPKPLELCVEGLNKDYKFNLLPVNYVTKHHVISPQVLQHSSIATHEALLSPCGVGDPHIATFCEEQQKCSTDTNKFGPLASNQLMWQDHSDSTALQGPLDLKTVRNALWDARSKWYHIGVELDIETSTLDIIGTECQGKVEDCFTKLLTTWLSRVTPQPSWSALVEALESPAVDHLKLVDKIKSKYMK